MSLPKSLPLRGLSRSAGGRVSVRTSRLQQWQRAGRRTYASAGGAAESVKHGVGSEIPWVVGALAVTVPGTFMILKSGHLQNPLSHPLPGDDHHGEEHGEEHEEGEEEGEEKEEGGEDEQAEDQGEGKEDEKADDSEGGDDSEEEQGEDSKEDGDGDDNADDQGSKSGGFKEIGKDEKGNTRMVKEDAKGGVKRRVESKNAIKLHDEGDSSEGDKAAATKTPVKGETSGKQAGLSNTDTKHSTDITNDPTKSKKSEGAPETAKLQGTVDPSRDQK